MICCARFLGENSEAKFYILTHIVLTNQRFFCCCLGREADAILGNIFSSSLHSPINVGEGLVDNTEQRNFSSEYFHPEMSQKSI